MDTSLAWFGEARLVLFKCGRAEFGKWKAKSWIVIVLESGQHIHWCSFTQDGLWLLTISRVLCIWQVTWQRPAVQETGRIHRQLSLSLHQKLAGDGSAHGPLKVAAMNHAHQKNNIMSGSLVVGTTSGVLSLWAQQEEPTSKVNAVLDVNTRNPPLLNLSRAVSDSSTQRGSLSLASTADADASSSSEEEEMIEPAMPEHKHVETLQEKAQVAVEERTANGGRALLKPGVLETRLEDHCGCWQQQVTTRSLSRPASRGGSFSCGRLSHVGLPGLEVAAAKTMPNPVAIQRTASNPPAMEKRQRPSSSLAQRRSSNALILGLASSGGHETRTGAMQLVTRSFENQKQGWN